MKIIEENYQKLVLEKKTGLNLFLFIWGLGFGGIPLVILISMFASLGVININCQRIEPTQVNCQIHRTGFGGLISQDFQILNNVINAKFEQIEGEDSDGATTIDNKVVLKTQQGQNFAIEDSIYINGVRGNAQQMRRIESEINNFLNVNQPSLVLNIDNRWRWSNLFIFGFISIFIVIGGTVLLGNILIIGYEKIVIDKLTSKCDYEKVNLLGKKKDTYNLREITRIIIEESTDSDGDKHYNLILPIANQKYTLDYGYHNFNGDRIRKTAEKISNFLQIKIENITK
jgi:hypothetical protein